MVSEPEDPRRCLELLQEYVRLLAQMEFDPRLRGRVDWTDVAQQTFVKSLENWHQYRGHTDHELRAWVRAILHNHQLDLERQYSRDGSDLQSSLDGSSFGGVAGIASDSTPASLRVIRGERIAELAAAMASLPKDQRTALEMRHLQGRSVAEISIQMGRTPKSVAGLLRRGLERLRAQLSKPE